MTLRRGFAVRAIALVGFALATLAAGAIVLWLDLEPTERQSMAALLPPPRVALIAMFVLALVAGLAAFAWRWYERTHAAAARMAAGLRLTLTANPSHRLVADACGDLAELGAAANDLADKASAMQRDVAEIVQSSNARLEEEKNRFAALIAELAQSVVVCNRDGRILLYNDAARHLFASALGDDANALLGLGRTIYGLIEQDAIEYALGARAQSTKHVAQFVATTRGGALLRVQLATVMGSENELPVLHGYVLLLADVTAEVEIDARQVTLVQEVVESTRAALANVRAAIETVIDFPDMAAARRERFTAIIRDEAERLSQRIDGVAQDLSDRARSRWPLEEIRGVDLVTLACRRIKERTRVRTRVEFADPALWLRVDSRSLAQGFAYLVRRIRDEFGVREVRFRLAAMGSHAQLDLIWNGPPVAPEIGEAWSAAAFSEGGEPSPLTWSEVVERHSGESLFRRDESSQTTIHRLLLPLTGAAQAPALRAVGPRPEFYDFDLFGKRTTGAQHEQQLLTELTYTVFDTETTGLDPTSGDEIIAIGAVRIVNGRLLPNETFEAIIDPGRSISEASIAVHGLTSADLYGRPTIEVVLPRFARFCADTVLVAHNAAFDMRFLQLKEATTGVSFHQPVLDTLLLSAVLHPTEEQSLEAIARRFDVTVAGRHTALGDALLTGELFLRMLPMLAERGIRSLGEARATSRKTYFARIRY
jgi:DNA polymerase-3 subunit epsilon